VFKKKKFLKDLFKKMIVQSLIWSQPQNLLLWPVPDPNGSHLRCGHHGHTSPPGPTPQAAVEGHRVTTQAPSLHGVAMDGSPAKKWGDHGMHGDSTNHVNQFFGDFTKHPISGFHLTKPPDHIQYPEGSQN